MYLDLLFRCLVQYIQQSLKLLVTSIIFLNCLPWVSNTKILEYVDDVITAMIPALVHNDDVHMEQRECFRQIRGAGDR